MGSNGVPYVSCETAQLSLSATCGACGSSNGQTFISAPSTNLCSVGTASSVTTGTSSYTWSCNGSEGGSVASCSASRSFVVTYVSSTGGSCTPSSRTIVYYQTSDAPSCTPSSGYTLTGFTRTSGSGGTLNTSTGAVTNVTGAQTIRADFVLVVVGSCGTANGQTLTSAPSTNLCSTGIASSVNGSGPWTWTCSGQNGGTYANCSAQKTQPVVTTINGKCSYYFGEILDSKPSTNLCSLGTASSVNGSGPWTWTCYGQNGGTSENCFVNVGRTSNYCGKSLYGYFYTLPSENLCLNGEEATGISYSEKEWIWHCNQGKAGCNAYKINDGQCGASNNKTFGYIPYEGLCSVGNPSLVIENNNSYTWTCSGINYGQSVSCSAIKTSNSVNGVCGSSNNKSFYDAPSSGLCNVGTVSVILKNGNSWFWNCNGSNNGVTDSCSANLRTGVALIVDSNTYNALSNEILRFKTDIERDTNYNVSILYNNWSSASQVRDKLVELFDNQGLAGAIFIGDIPIMYITTEYEGTIYPKIPSDYYYQKLDGKNWNEETSDTIIQDINQKSNSFRSIWTGRLYPPTINSFENKIKLLKEYFDRNHAYRINEFSYNKKLLFTDSQAQKILDGEDMYQEIRSLADNIPNYTKLYNNSSNIDIAYSVSVEERKKEILEKIKDNYEIAIINIHGSSRSQWIGEKTNIVSSDIIQNGSGSLFVALESCSNGNLTDRDYIAGWYLFSGQSLLIRANTTVTMYVGMINGLLSPNYFESYQLISSGSNFGDLYRITNNGVQSILFGDPTLSIR